MSERQTPSRFQIAPDPQTAHLPIDHPIRRRSLLLSLAGTAALQACGGDVLGSGEGGGDVAGEAAEALDEVSSNGAQAASVSGTGRAEWVKLQPIPAMDWPPTGQWYGEFVPRMLSFAGLLWLFGDNMVSASDDGITWNTMNQAVRNGSTNDPLKDWSGAAAHSFVFKGRMWLISASNGTTFSSANGVSWRKEGVLPSGVTASVWSLSSRASVVFQNQIWLLGGRRTGKTLHDLSTQTSDFCQEIWKSADGKTWSQVAPVGAFWAPRCIRNNVTVFQNKLWIIGGQGNIGANSNYHDPGYSDAWTSTDGVNWSSTGRNPSGTFDHNVQAFDGKLWVMWGLSVGSLSGTRGQASFSHYVSYSSDGNNWSGFPTIEGPPRPGLQPRMYAEYGYPTVHGNALITTKGAMLTPYVWERVPQVEVPHFGPRRAMSAVSNGSATNPKMWLIGGVRLDNAAISNEVWESADGSAWALSKADTASISGTPYVANDWAGRVTMSSVYFNNRIWVIGGWNRNASYVDDVWSSADGKSWRRETTGVACLKRLFHSVVVFKGKIWMFGGQNTLAGMNYPRPEGQTVFYNDVWNSSDGNAWTRVTANAPWAGRGMIYGSVVYNNRLWVIGGGRYAVTDAPEVSYNDVWSTADGVTWTRHTANAPWFARRAHQVFVFDNRMWVLGGWSNTRAQQGWGGHIGDLWSSTDGANWTRQPVGLADVAMPQADSAVVVHGGVPYIIGGPNANDVWRLKRR